MICLISIIFLIEAGIAYGMGKKCYAIGEFDSTDSLYNIFDNIFSNINELEDFLKGKMIDDFNF